MYQTFRRGLKCDFLRSYCQFLWCGPSNLCWNSPHRSIWYRTVLQLLSSASQNLLPKAEPVVALVGKGAIGKWRKFYHFLIVHCECYFPLQISGEINLYVSVYSFIYWASKPLQYSCQRYDKYFFLENKDFILKWVGTVNCFVWLKVQWHNASFEPHWIRLIDS